MSFIINTPSAQPVIKAAANMNNDGGSGGNTGYMMRRKKKDEQMHKNPFEGEAKIDAFVSESKLPFNEDELFEQSGSWLSNIMKNFIK